jgi:hypothetical protein
VSDSDDAINDAAIAVEEANDGEQGGKKGKKEDFTLSHRFHLDSRWTPGGFPESMWSLDYFFFGGSPANFLSRIHVESMWSPVGLHVTPSGPHGLHLRTQA